MIDPKGMPDWMIIGSHLVGAVALTLLMAASALWFVGPCGAALFGAVVNAVFWTGREVLQNVWKGRGPFERWSRRKRLEAAVPMVTGAVVAVVFCALGVM